MDAVLDSATAVGLRSESVQMRVAADAAALGTAAERNAYLLGMQAAFLTILSPTYTNRPPPSLAAPAPPSAPRAPSPTVPRPRIVAPTLVSMGRQRPSVPNVGADHLTPSEIQLPDSPSSGLLAGLLEPLAPPLDLHTRYIPSRWLLLCAYDACHGHGCQLQQQRKGLLSQALREKCTLTLFWRLSGITADSVRPGSGPAPAALYTEAAFVHRRTRSGVSRLSQPLRRWLLEPPSALAKSLDAPPRSPSPTQSFSPVLSDRDTAKRREKIPSSPSDERVVSSHGKAGAPGAHLAANPSGTSAPSGFLSTSHRSLQPTAAEEASLRDCWRACDL
jgi:hypothetical protein